jgi:hypothetical protein
MRGDARRAERGGDEEAIHLGPRAIDWEGQLKHDGGRPPAASGGVRHGVEARAAVHCTYYPLCLGMGRKGMNGQEGHA